MRIDDTLKRIFKEVAEKEKLELKVIEDIFAFQQRRIKEVIKEMPKSNVAEIKIPYICRLVYNERAYDKYEEAVAKGKAKELNTSEFEV